jgi:tetratricopeptide (TPR) repeat protein
MPVLTYAIVQSALRFAAPDQPVFPLSDLFSFSRDRLIRADRRLAMAPEIGEGAMGLSMRVYLRYTLILERQADDPQSQLAEAEDFINRATILAPADATVMSLSALFHSWKRDVAGALDMARLALRLCPDSDLAQHVLSQALTDAGRDREALDMAMRAGHGPMGLVGQATWLLRRMVSHLRLGQLEQAEQAAAAARAHAPDNRPSLRFLAALRWRRGDEIGTADALARLRLLEPDFTLDLMASPDYPVTTLRQMGLLDVTRSGL